MELRGHLGLGQDVVVFELDGSPKHFHQGLEKSLGILLGRRGQVSDHVDIVARTRPVVRKQPKPISLTVIQTKKKKNQRKVCIGVQGEDSSMVHQK
eukprot:UC4_evm1s510